MILTQVKNKNFLIKNNSQLKVYSIPHDTQCVPKAKNLTTISITRTTYENLKNLGKTGDTFNDVITRLLSQNGGNQ